MKIDSSTGLLIGLALSLLGVAGCLYLIIRSVRKMMSGGGSSPAHHAGSTTVSQNPSNWRGWLFRAKKWLSEPVSSTRPGKEPHSNASQPRETRARPPEDRLTTPELETTDGGLEVMRVLRVGALGELIIEAEGMRYRRMTDIKDGAIGRRVLLAIQELNEMAGEHVHRVLPEVHRLGDSAAPCSEPDQLLSSPQRAFLTQLQEESVEDEPPPAKPGLVEYWRKGLSRSERQAATQASEQEPKSFIDEIDAILQGQLAARPDMQGRSIHFRSTAAGELRIDVDDSWFETVDAVPDGDVKSLLQATIRSWEQR